MGWYYCPPPCLIIMSDLDKNKDFIRWLNKDLTEEELYKIESDPDFQKYSRILDEVGKWQLPPHDKKKGYEKLTKLKTINKTIYWYRGTFAKIAAVFLLLAVAFTWLILSEKSVTYETGIAETEVINLPDGSIVHLAASSSLSYNKQEWGKRRELSLKGAGHFSVEKGPPFKVDFTHGTVQVLGTSFEIKTLGDFASVACYDGKVEVVTADNKATLSKGKAAKINSNNSIELFEFSNHNWSQDISRFYSAPLYAVFESMENQFGIRIKYNNIDLTRTFTGSYSNNDLDQALMMVCVPMDISYEVNEKTVTLR